MIAMAEAISSGLRRKSIVSCSRWSERYRIMGKPFSGPLTFKWHPWLRDMQDCDSEMWVGQKAAQMGFTECAINRVFYTIDIKRVDCLYILPSQTPDASVFSSARFDAALEASEYLSTLFSDVRNVGHKRAGPVNLYIRGSHSKSGLKSIPAGLIVMDELEEMEQDNINLAMERQSGQTERQTIAISTPRIAGQGINRLYQDSTQEHFFFRCPFCAKLTELIFPDCMVITAESTVDTRIKDTYLQCRECKHHLDHTTKHEWLASGRWVPEHTDRDIRGFHINQLYSCAEEPSRIALLYLKSQSDKSAEQEFYNSKLGEVHEVQGARISDFEIDDCIDNYSIPAQVKQSSIITMGIDQGGVIHYEIDEWYIHPYTTTIDINADSRCKLIDCGKVRQFEDLDVLMRKWGVNCCVIDAQPEKRKALEFAMRWSGFVYMCYYGNGVNGKDLTQWSNEPTITVDRTSWLDASLGRFHNRQLISLPMNLPLEYREHIKCPVRTYDKDRNGNVIGRYVTPDRTADHYAHARNYSEIALKMQSSVGQSQNIRSPR